MCLVHRGDYSFTIFLPPNFTIRARHSVVERGEAEEQLSLNCRKKCVNILSSLLLCFTGISLEMDGLLGMERQKFPFTIENILSKYSNGDRRSCGTSGAGLKERAPSPAGGQTETVHHTCLCCCYCSHCGDIYQTDFIHEGKIKPILLMRRVTFVYFCFQLLLTVLSAACQYGWPPAMLTDPCRLGDAHREEQTPGQVQRRTRRHRTIFTEEQLDALEELFLQNQYPDVNTREKLAQRTHLREERVEVRL